MYRVHGVALDSRLLTLHLKGLGAVVAVRNVVDAGRGSAEGFDDVPRVPRVDGRRPREDTGRVGVYGGRGRDDYAGAEGEEGGGGVTEVGGVCLYYFRLVAKES